MIAQADSFAAGAWLVWGMVNPNLSRFLLHRVFSKKAFTDLLGTNFYLMIRTVCMLIMVNIFMARSAVSGGVILVANAILFQLQYIMGDVLDGLSSASGVYSGLAVGGRDRGLFQTDLRLSGVWAAIFSVAMSAVFFLTEERVLKLFTDLPEVLAAAGEYSFYITIFPPIAAAGIVYYGIFNGALKTRMICWSMLMTLTVFLAAERILPPLLGNHGLWLAFIVFYIGRSVFLMMFLPALKRKLNLA